MNEYMHSMSDRIATNTEDLDKKVDISVMGRKKNMKNRKFNHKKRWKPSQ